jgi:hypothetical protein
MAIYRLRRKSTVQSILALCEQHDGIVIKKRAMGEIFTIKKHFISCDRPRKPWYWLARSSNAIVILEAIPDGGLVITVDRSPWFLLERCNASLS